MRLKDCMMVASLAAMALLNAGSASAQCAFDAPAKAKSLKSSMVRALAGCPSVTFVSPNTTTMAGVPGCAAPSTLSAYEFGPKGQCTFSWRTNSEVPCDSAFQPECANPRFTAKCSDVQLSGLPATDDGWILSVVIRATIDDQSNGDMTVVDSQVYFSFPPANAGKLSLRGELNDLACLFDPCQPLPLCSSFEILTASIKDPDGNVFAKMGTSGR